MAIPHAKPAEVINVRPLGSAFAGAQTTTLVKTDALEVIRLVLPAAKALKPHEVPGEVTVQCLEGEVAFGTADSECVLTAGDLIYLSGSEEHSVRAKEDSSLLLTILLHHKKS